MKDTDRRSLWALVITNVTTSLTDNVMKTFILLHLIKQGRWVGAVATMAFVLPYLLLSPLAGNVGDHFSRTRLLQLYKLSELMVAGLGCLGMILQSTPIMLSTLVLFGIQITLISPVKLGLLPEIVPETQLVSANGLLDGTVFMAILIGTALASLLTSSWLCLVMVSSTVLGLIASFYLRHTRGDKHPLSFNWFGSIGHMISVTHQAGKITVALLLSLFWSVASVILTLIPSSMHLLATRQELPLTENNAASVLMILTTITLGVGSFLAGRVPNLWRVSVSFLAIMLIGAVGFMLNVSWESDIITLALGGFAAGICSSQFYAQLIHNTDGYSSTISAANNILNALGMTIASCLLMV